jgi:hypothetical protein
MFIIGDSLKTVKTAEPGVRGTPLPQGGLDVVVTLTE